MAPAEVMELDVAVIGAGFAGLCALYKFRNCLSLRTHAFDSAGGVGGTWEVNRYPGARSDTEVTAYSYSFDRELYFSWQWESRYPRESEIRGYLNAIADKHKLREHISLHTTVTKMVFDETANRWILSLDTGATVRAQFVVEGVGLLSSVNVPTFANQEAFTGQIYHTAKWPHTPVDLAGKRVAVIGTGSSGIQVISEIADKVGHLTVFQRSPQYVVPSQNRTIDPVLLEKIGANWDKYWRDLLYSTTAFGFVESAVSAESVSPAEREKVFQKAWAGGGGFQFMFQTFNDIGTSEVANEAAAEFIRRKVTEAVKDEEMRKKLTPWGLWARRPLCCDGYFEVYNRPNVTLIDCKATSIVSFTPAGIQTSDGLEHPCDIVILATGFDAVTGQYLKIETIGRRGLSLQDKWKDRARVFMGLFMHSFPNLFTIFGPMGPFTNQPPVHEAQIDFIAKIVGWMRERGVETVEPSEEAEKEWLRLCDEIGEATLFPRCDSWINGANVEGKPKVIYFFMGGMAAYMEKMTEVEKNGYLAFQFGKGVQ